MPPRVKITKDDILSAGMALVRAGGEEAVNARAIAEKLACSTQPIFSNYPTMEALWKDILAQAQQVYESRISAAMAAGEYPPYKASGMAYIRFAREEHQLFRLLFMRDRTGEKIEENRAAIGDILRVIQEKTGLSGDEAYRFHMEMWIWVHGIATMSATGYLDWPMEMVSDMLTEMFQALLARYTKKEEA